MATNNCTCLMEKNSPICLYQMEYLIDSESKQFPSDEQNQIQQEIQKSKLTFVIKSNDINYTINLRNMTIKSHNSGDSQNIQYGCYGKRILLKKQ